MLLKQCSITFPRHMTRSFTGKILYCGSYCSIPACSEDSKVDQCYYAKQTVVAENKKQLLLSCAD